MTRNDRSRRGSATSSWSSRSCSTAPTAPGLDHDRIDDHDRRRHRARHAAPPDRPERDVELQVDDHVVIVSLRRRAASPPRPRVRAPVRGGAAHRAGRHRGAPGRALAHDAAATSTARPGRSSSPACRSPDARRRRLGRADDPAERRVRAGLEPPARSDRGLDLGVDLHARAHRRRRGDALEVAALRRGRLRASGSRRARRRSSARGSRPGS